MTSKRCLIIGATSDIAKELTYLFAKDGYTLDLTARRVEELERTKQDLEIRYGADVHIFSLDIEDYLSIEKFINGYNQIPTVVVFAIGYLGNQKEAESNWQEAKKIIDINYTNQIPLLNHFANIMKEAKQGTIIGISSIAGERGRKANYFYGSAKAALTQHLSGLRQRLHSSGVSVITVKPGFIRTKMTKNLSVPSLFEGIPRKVASKVYIGYLKKKLVIITPFVYFPLNIVIKLLPEKIFRKINI